MKRLNNGFNRGMDRLLDCVARFTFLSIAVVLSSVLNAVFVVLDADLNVFFFLFLFSSVSVDWVPQHRSRGAPLARPGAV